MADRPDDSSVPPSAADSQRTLMEPRLPGGATQGGGERVVVEPSLAPLSRWGDYEILEEIGRGGMGVVFKARHVRLGRVVALKMILGGALARADDLARFETEAAAAAQLRHPGIIGLYEVGAHQNQPYFSMEFISGTSLAQRLAQGPMSGRKAATHLEAMARAIHFAHNHGVLHRDLKPANILFDENDQPKITDFGLAKVLATDSGQTRTGAVLGTPSYMSPEQAAGAKSLGPSTDVWSLGAILYELLTGRPPFRGETALATVQLVAEQDPVAPRLLNPAVDRDLETICLKCLEKSPARRYASAEALADDLRRYLNEEPISARRLSWLGRCVKWCRRKPAAATLAFVSVTAVIGFVIVLWQVNLEERDLRRQAEEAQRLALIREGGMRHLLYLSQVRAAQQALDNADLDRAESLLMSFDRPKFAELRDWEWHFLKQRLGGRYSLEAHKDRATAVAYRADGKRVATAGGIPAKPGEIKVWDTANGKLLATLRGHANSITALAYHPDGILLASASFDETVKIWDLEAGTELATLRGHRDQVAAVAFAPAGDLLASAGGDRIVRLWSEPAWRKGDKGAVRTLAGHTAAVAALAFAPDGKTLVSGGLDAMVRIWDVASGKAKDTLKGHEGPVLAASFHPSGVFFATGGGLGTKRGEVKFWEAANGKLLFSRYGLSDQVLSLSFSRQEQLAAAAADGLLYLWDRALSSEAHRFRADPKRVFSVAFSPSGRHLAWGGRNGRVTFANSSGGMESLSLGATGRVEAVAFNPVGRFIATACKGRLEVWNLDHPERSIALPAPAGIPRALAFSPDGQLLAVAGDDQAVSVYDLQIPEREPRVFRGHAGPVRSLSFHPEGRLLASGSDDESVRVWNVETGTIERILSEHRGNVLTVAFSPDKRTLASASMDKTIRLWDVRSWESAALTGHDGWVNAIAFGPDGQQLASASQDKTLRLWDVAERRQYMKLEVAPGAVLSLAFHPGGRRLVTSGQDGVLRLWDTVTRQEILELIDPTGSVREVAFSQDGRFLAAAGLGATRVWDGGLDASVKK